MDNYPKGALPNQAKQGEIIKPCFHCGKELALKKWHSWNGFLVECPHCHGLHGKRWNIRRVLLASFLFSAFSFLFTMRPRNAVLILLGFIVAAFIGNYILDRLPDLLQIVIVIVFIFSPMLVNAIILMKHERDLDNSAPPRQAFNKTS